MFVILEESILNKSFLLIIQNFENIYSIKRLAKDFENPVDIGRTKSMNQRRRSLKSHRSKI